jgi:hypothetical protein
MHNSMVVRICLMLQVPLASIIGWLFYAFVYELGVESPLIPCSLVAIIVLMMWASMELTDK